MQQGKTSMNKRFPIKNYTIEKIFHTILQKIDWGWYLGRLFSQHPDQLERNSLNCRQRQHLLYLSTKSHPSLTSVAEMGEESREHSFQLIYQSDGIWCIRQLNTSYIAKNVEMSCKTPVTTCVTAF